MFINTSYGTLSYAFSVLVTRSGPGGEFGAGFVALAFGLALLVSGIAALATGVIADRFGTRPLMALGAGAGAGGLALLAACDARWQFIAVMLVVIGPAMAATFYEPVYVLMNRWFEARERPRAYGVLTLLSGFSITIFTPLTRSLVDGLGWREALLVLAAILLGVGLLVPALIREPRVAPRPNVPRGRRTALFVDLREALGHTTRAFWLFSAAFFAATVAFSGYSFHMIAQLEARGFDETAVASAIAITGIVSLPARLLLPALSGRAPSTLLLGACLALLALAAWIATLANAWWQVWVYIAVFGAVFGAVYPLRALVVSERFAGPYFGRVIGMQALTVAVARACGPPLAGLFGTDREGYAWSFRIAAVVLLLSAVACWWTMRRPVALPQGDADGIHV